MKKWGVISISLLLFLASAFVYSKSCEAIEDLRQSTSTNITQEKEAEIHEQPDFSDVGAGLGVASEQIFLQGRKFAEKHGEAFPAHPYYERARAIYAQIEKHGYQRKTLYSIYLPILLRTAQVLEDEIQKAVKTREFIELFEKKNEEAIENRIALRLKQNPNDVPALLMQLDLHSSQRLTKEIFDDIEKIISALDEYEPKAMDKRALLYYAMNLGDFYAYSTEDFIAELKTRKNETFTLMSVPLLCSLENAGDW